MKPDRPSNVTRRMGMKRTAATDLRAMLGALAILCPAPTAAQTCPLHTPSVGAVQGPLGAASPMIGTAPDMVSFSSGLSRDEDGNPRAYHRGLTTAEKEDDGLDHICNGMTVLELVDGRLRNRYHHGGSGGSLEVEDDDVRHARTLACKRDYIALRELQFPLCGPHQPTCGLFVGIAHEPRACGYPGVSKLKASDTRCGIPILQKDAQ